MLTLPASIITLLQPFRPVFSQPTWVKAQVLFVGTIMATGKRTVTSALRVMGLSDERQFSKYHHVLNRAVWSPHRVAELLLALLMSYLDGDEQQPLVFGIDETIERRWGPRIAARGIYRDAVRSSASHFVKTSGLRWISMMWLTTIPWAQRVWALPFLTVLAPSKRYYEGSGRQHKKLTDWARQMIMQLRRWVPHRKLVVVADYSYAALELLHACQRLSNPVTMITRLRLDAALYEPAPPYGGKGRPRKKGKRLPTLAAVLADKGTAWALVSLPWYDGQERELEIASQTAVWYHTGQPPVPLRWVLIRDPLGDYETVALLSTCLDLLPAQIAHWFVLRWQVEVTFEEARAHLGVESQRQWSDKAIARTTPVLLGLFSWVTLAAHLLVQHVRSQSARLPGMSKFVPLSLTPSVGCVKYSGFPLRLFGCHLRKPIW
jgi:hypothetical protein